MLRQLKYRLEYLPVMLLDGFFHLWSRRVAVLMGERIGLALSLLMGSRRRLVKANLAAAFPEKTSTEIEVIAKNFWKNLGRVAIEFIRLDDLNQSNFHDYFEFEGLEYIKTSKAQGKGTILIGFHFTNWEYSGVGYQFFFHDLIAIARPMKNPFVEKWVQSKRAGNGMDIILHRNAVKESLRTLKKNKSIGILVDQNLYQGGVFVEFFGRPAASTTLPALLESRTDADVMLMYVRRLGDKFKLIIEPPLSFPPAGENYLQERTQIISDHVERAIRQSPESWFWIHNRWKRKPEGSREAAPV